MYLKIRIYLRRHARLRVGYLKCRYRTQGLVNVDPVDQALSTPQEGWGPGSVLREQYPKLDIMNIIGAINPRKPRLPLIEAIHRFSLWRAFASEGRYGFLWTSGADLHSNGSQRVHYWRTTVMRDGYGPGSRTF